MKYIIEDTSGRFWNGECWSVRQVAQEYDGVDDLPVELTDGDSCVELVETGDVADYLYCDSETDEPVAGLRRVREVGDPL